MAVSDPLTAENDLIAQVANTGVPAVIVPSLEHFVDGRPPEALLRLADVLVMEPKTTFTRLEPEQAAS
ncbi:hypothetical protein D5S18_24940 [Nocardia panacis]|uniref:Uncharacterized protein n=1 Tax=Nocardia panacis TaxID=2340916 RepID=A0A3A4KCB6_9NOCA|nr:hypothetical protein [Nocardia panacis]RJO71420.1 hypothetical protein D5S18_24940 [Nocardia panacis]